MLVSELEDLLAEALVNETLAIGNSLLDPLFRQTYGCAELLRNKIERLRHHCLLFMQAYGDGPVAVMRAAARINLLGEHVDYVSYLPTASLTIASREHDMILLFRPSGSGRVRGTSTLDGCEAFSFDLADGPAQGSVAETDSEWERYLYAHPAPAPHWGNYFQGAAYFARMKFGDRVLQGIDALIDSSMPSAGGASSSSALTVLAGAAIRRVNRIPCDPLQLALESAKAEWFVGTRGGTMDHLTICLSRQKHLVHISYSEGAPVLVPMPHERFRLATFFAHPADKSRQVMLEYNERAAVSRILIPAIIDDWTARDSGLRASWEAALAALRAGSPGAPDNLEQVICLLPGRLTLAEVETQYPEAYRACARAFQALVRERIGLPLKIRDRARHHLGEVQRVASAHLALQEMNSPAGPDDTDHVETGMRRIGKLLNESHASLRDLYGVCTPEVNRLVDIILSDPMVYGARLMGGGFGGNVLALTTADNVSSLIDRVQTRFYEPRGRNGAKEGSVMASTTGDGLAALDAEGAARNTVEHFNRRWRESNKDRIEICRMLDRFKPDQPAAEVWPLILAAGKGARAKASGLEVPKPLAPVLGVPATVRVLQVVKAACRMTPKPVVIVSPETAVCEVLKDEAVNFIVQPAASGTGDAILCACEHMQDFAGRVLVIWGTQPVIRVDTLRRTLKLASLFPEYTMVVPTALMNRPYAPILRDDGGRIRAAQETHLEQAQAVEFGESNIGLFVLWNQAMFEELTELRRKFWRQTEGRYDRPRGELGFPNEMIRSLAARPGGVLASPIADWREEKGIKGRADIDLCEQYILQLSQEV